MTGDGVLLAGRCRDPELAAVGALLRRAGVPVLPVTFPQLVTGRLSWDPAAGRLRLGRRTVRPTVAWVRHPPRPVTTAPGTGSGTGPGSGPDTRPGPGSGVGAHTGAGGLAAAGSAAAWSAEAAFAADSRAVLARQIGWAAPVWFPGPDLELPRQLAEASRLGFRVPATVVADQPEAAPRRWRRVIIKALDRHFVTAPDGSLRWFHPQIWDRRETPPWPAPGLPALLQEFVEHQAEFRVYVVGEHACAFQVSKRRPADIWLDPDRVGVRVAAAPPGVVTAAVALARHWGLRYGAFDFLIDGGQPVFLEVNPDGDWRWFEVRAGRPEVTRRAARTLANLHRAHRRTGQGDDRIEPISFLAG